MYLIDSDVLIDAKNRHYGFDIAPAFWAWIEQQYQTERVFTVQRVADEVLARADELADWMNARPATFRLPARPDDQPSLEAVSRWVAGAGYQQAAVATFLQAGDYFLVAQAHSRGFTVVTQEIPDPVVSRKRIKIRMPVKPSACPG